MVDGEPVLTYDRDGNAAYAVDYFNPNITAYMKTFFDKIRTQNTALWLDKNIPFMISNNATGKVDKSLNPFAEIPLWPGSDSTYKNTLPVFAQHALGYGKGKLY